MAYTAYKPKVQKTTLAAPLAPAKPQAQPMAPSKPAPTAGGGLASASMGMGAAPPKSVAQQQAAPGGVGQVAAKPSAQPAADAWASLMASQGGTPNGGGANATGLHVAQPLGSASSGFNPQSAPASLAQGKLAPKSLAESMPQPASTPPQLGGGNPQDDAAVGDGAPPDYETDASDMWLGVMSDYDDSLGGKINQTYADEARAGRTADVQSSMLGQSVSGGGAQAGQAQVALGGMAQRQDVMNEHTKQGLTMKLSYLETLIKRAEASKDRALEEKLRAESDKTLLLLSGVNIDTTNYGDGGAGGADIDSQLNQNFDGRNGWTSINEGIKSEGWNRQQIDSAKKFSAEYYAEYGQWPTLATIKTYGLTGQSTTSAGASNGLAGAVFGDNYDENGQPKE